MEYAAFLGNRVKMERNKLAILSLGDLPTTVSMGGTRRVALEFCLALGKRGHCVVAEAPWVSGSELVNKDSNVKIRRFGNPTMRRLIGHQLMMTWGAYRATRSALSQADVAVILAHNTGACAGATWAMRSLQKRIPVVYLFYASHADEIRTGAHQYNRFGTLPAGRIFRPAISNLKVKQLARAEANSLSDATQIVTLSCYAKEWAQRLYGTENSRFTIVPAGVDTRRFSPPHVDISAVRQKLGLPEKRFILFTLRNLHPRMGVDVLVKAMPEVLASYPETSLFIGGSGILLESLQQTISALDLQQTVQLLGHISEADLPAYYQAADLFMLPTQAMEGFGMVTLEALACGTPVLGTPVGATPEILAPLGAEFLTEGCDAHTLRDGILRMRAELSQRSDIRPQCRNLVETRYTWGIAAAQLEEVLYSAINLPEDSPL